MSSQDIHFMREVLVTDFQNKQVPTMEISRSNADALHPLFKHAAFYEMEEFHTLYIKLGGGRREGALNGSTVIIPNRTRWENTRSISAAEVKVVESVDAGERTAQTQSELDDVTHARDKAMRGYTKGQD